MAEQKIASELRQIAQEWYSMIMGAKVAKFKYIKHIMVGIALLGVVGSTFLMYRFWVVYRERASQKVFAESVEKYNVAFQSEAPDWEDIAVLFEKQYQQNTRSYLAPYLLQYKAEALLQQGRKSEAVEVMDRVIGQLQASSPLLPLLKTKRALIKLDIPDEVMNQAGLEELEDLVRDTKNQFKDVSLFYLGRYYWSTDRIAQAKQVWQQLVNEQRQQKLAPSPWADEVKEKLASVI